MSWWVRWPGFHRFLAIETRWSGWFSLCLCPYGGGSRRLSAWIMILSLHLFTAAHCRRIICLPSSPGYLCVPLGVVGGAFQYRRLFFQLSYLRIHFWLICEWCYPCWRSKSQSVDWLAYTLCQTLLVHWLASNMTDEYPFPFAIHLCHFHLPCHLNTLCLGNPSSSLLLCNECSLWIALYHFDLPIIFKNPVLPTFSYLACWHLIGFDWCHQRSLLLIAFLDW